MQRRSEGIKRERISVSLDADDYEFVQSISGGSDSQKLAKIVKAARLNKLTIDDQTQPMLSTEFVDWLSNKKSKSAKELHKLLSEFLDKH